MKNKKQTKTLIDWENKARSYLTKWYYKKYSGDDCFVAHLETWLACLYDGDHDLPEGYYYYMMDGSFHYHKHGQPMHIIMWFDYETGQPREDHDYMKFCELVGI
jgi:hypothetical protein